MDFFYNNFNNLEDTTSSGKKKEKEDGQSDKWGLFCHSVLLGALVCSLQLAFCNGAHANIWIGSDTGSDYDSSNNPVPEGTAYDEIYGGKIDKSSSTEAAKAKNNILRLNSNHLLNTKGKIYGGYARSEKEAEASSNNVEFSNVKFENVAEICGGYAGNTVSSTSFTATSTDNHVTLSDSSSVSISRADVAIYGGYAYANTLQHAIEDGVASSSFTTTATGNSVALSDSASVSGSHATIYGGSTYASNILSLYGTYNKDDAVSSSFTATATGNYVTLSDSAVVPGPGSIFGGCANTHNDLYLNGTFNKEAAVSPSFTAAATGNRVTLSDSASVSGLINGGWSFATSYTIDLNGTYNKDAYISSFFTSYATGNRVTLSDSASVSGSINGGCAFATCGDQNIGTYDKDASISLSFTATVTGNSVTLSDSSSITGSNARICGGYAYISCPIIATDDKDVAVSSSFAATANGNSIILYGGSVKGATIYGGESSVIAYTTDTTSDNFNVKCTASASNNTVALYPYIDEADAAEAKMPELDGADIWGGYAAATVNGEHTKGTVSGNTLEFHAVKNLTAGNIHNFSNLTFTLPSMTAGETVLILTDAKGTDISGSIVTVTNEIIDLKGADGGEFKKGDEVVLLKNANGLTKERVGYNSREFHGQPDAAARKLLGQTGISLQYQLELQETETSIVLKCADITKSVQDKDTVLPQTKAIAEGAAAGLALVNEAANAGMAFARSFSPEEGIAAPFVYVQGSSLTHETGSNVHLNAVSLMAGIGGGLETGAGKLSSGAFFEYGRGSYTTNNSFDNAADVNGDGTSWYMGGGLLAKMEFLETGPGHFYVEGSAHMGQLHNQYDSKDLQDAGGRIARFDLDSPYYSLHGGLGYVWDITETQELDVYGDYIWTRVQGTDETLTTGDKFEFDDMDSSRVRFGARYTYKGHERFKPYVGVAYEHEFAGSCESTTFGHNVAAPSFEGDTGMGELGITMTPSKDLPLSVNLGVQGYVGQKQGVSGNCLIKYEF